MVEEDSRLVERPAVVCGVSAHRSFGRFRPASVRKALQLSDIVIPDEPVKEGSLVCSGDVGRERRVHGSSAEYLSPNDETGLIYTWVDTTKAGAESESLQIILVRGQVEW